MQVIHAYGIGGRMPWSMSRDARRISLAAYQPATKCLRLTVADGDWCGLPTFGPRNIYSVNWKTPNVPAYIPVNLPATCVFVELLRPLY
ncbi:hypothetical protein Trydic_g6704 [Trypoxylus dichotomus]